MRQRVLVVDDSAFMRTIITDLITEDPGFTVIDTAKNGAEAVRKTKELAPDIVTMDVEMPLMNGLEALRTIMRECPTPVVMLSSHTDSGARETIAALELGAVDFVQKPSGTISLDIHKVKRQLLDKLKAATGAQLMRLMPAKAGNGKDGAEEASLSATGKPAIRENPPKIAQLAAIGTSTGGPRALQAVLGAIPADFPAPILVVQHMPPSFTRSLAERLDSLCDIHVAEARDGEAIEPGTAYIAPGGWHMRLERSAGGIYRIRLSRDDPRNGHRPSVDVLFESLVPLTELKRVAVIMTGMGSDGARGLKELKESGAITLAESEETCVVYGMPRAAVEMQAADLVLKLQEIPRKMTEIVQEG